MNLRSRYALHFYLSGGAQRDRRFTRSDIVANENFHKMYITFVSLCCDLREQKFNDFVFFQNATCFATEKGLKVTVEDSKCVQASAFIQKEMFQVGVIGSTCVCGCNNY